MRANSKRKFTFPVGYHRFHDDQLFNFQLNRWYSLGYLHLEDMRDVGRRVTNFADWKTAMTGMAEQAVSEERLMEAAFFYRAAEFYTFLTPNEILSYLGRLRGMQGERLKSRIKEVIHLVGLDRWIDVKIEKFSRGMKQRLALAQTLLHDPPILILDEPGLGLDPRGVVEFRQIIEEVGKQKTVFFASHQLVEVTQICKQVAIIDHGKLLVYASIDELEKKYESLEKAYLELTGGVS